MVDGSKPPSVWPADGSIAAERVAPPYTSDGWVYILLYENSL